MKRIAMLVPYFGTFPDYFPLWLLSCGCNPDIDFLVFTDDRRPFDWPENVKITYLSWKQMQDKVRSCFDFPVKVPRPYKLCDYRPAYGEIFEEELVGYDFWGHCDLDVVWGALREFVSEELLDHYDKLFYRGHFSLYRNTKRVNGLYRCPVEGKPLYRAVFQDSAPRVFDEWTGIDRIFDEQGIPVYDSPVVADIYADHYHFTVNGDMWDKERPQVFLWRKENGRCRIFRYYRDHGNFVRQEFMYIHLQKRKMALSSGTRRADAFLIVPNRFLPCEGLARLLEDPETTDETAAAMIKKFYRRRLVNWGLLRKKWARKVRKLKCYFTR